MRATSVKTLPNYEIESQYGNVIIAGADEVGRGALAGPIVAAAVIIDATKMLEGINDSKKLSLRARQKLYDEITQNYIWSVSIVPANTIDEIGIAAANMQACINALKALSKQPEIALIDGNMRFEDERFISVIKGDSKSISIAASSIIAKVTRDRIMQELAGNYPYYHWHKNVGYGTKEHIAAIGEYGLSDQHRRSFHCKNLAK